VLVSVDAAAMMPEVDVIVCCTSSTEHIVRDESLRSGAVVCDVSRPSNVTVDVGFRRPDVMLLNGGVVRMPGDASLGVNASLAEGHAYACMAETMMLAMDSRYQDMSLGFDLPLSQILDIEHLAAELDFEVVLDHKEKGGKEEYNDISDKFAKSADFRTVCAQP
jgi:fatty aldehyde-generating acyl-ACP reductase